MKTTNQSEISFEEFETIEPGDTIRVSRGLKLGSAQMGHVKGGFDAVVINRYENSVSVHLAGQSNEIMRELQGKTVINQRYIEKILFQPRKGGVISKPDHKGPTQANISSMAEQAYRSRDSMQQRQKRAWDLRQKGLSALQIAGRMHLAKTTIYKYLAQASKQQKSAVTEG
ncbi:hypothetical protein [Lacticaseibacillus zhaodongensis]|uniref:hypothetical protein n=1 Tax=Lacticaseibacillus zhaodongensis TaxID=2668065 RepID=UPI0012D3092E|nr:hypothetical protein [Lacticaseibacillus zhaodongensis]